MLDFNHAKKSNSSIVTILVVLI